jgi:branched-chain amino acid transport system substrate-binding protein
MKFLFAALAAGSLALASGASAQAVKIGMTVSTTGPAASLGIPEANTAKLMPKEIGGVPVEVIVLDDASDTTKGVANTRKLLTDDKVDVIVGSSTTPVSLAMIEVVSEVKAPMISLAASAAIVSPMDDKRRWVFKTPQNDRLMADALVDYIAAQKLKSIAFIGFNDAYGDGWLNVLTPALKEKNVQLVASERYARTDTSVTGPVLKLMAAKPEAVLIAGSGTPAALPQKTLKERGYTGKIYQTHGVANGDFLRVGGKDVEGTILPAGPVLVAAQLPESNPVKKAGLEYVQKYDTMFGAGTSSTFGAHANDALALLQAAIPVAAKAAKPGTPEFRSALRDALEGLKDVVYSQGVVTMSKDDHVGQDKRARVMVTIENGAWKLIADTATQ